MVETKSPLTGLTSHIHIADEDQGASPLLQWRFPAGSQFKAREQWWGERKLRNNPHEGIDLLEYIDGQGTLHRLTERVLIPAWCVSEVEVLLQDFLGITVVVSHPEFRAGKWRLLSLYGHLQPLPQIRGGALLAEGTPLGRLAIANNPQYNCPDHLHFSVTWALVDYDLAAFSWHDLWDPRFFRPIDPAASLASPEKMP